MRERPYALLTTAGNNAGVFDCLEGLVVHCTEERRYPSIGPAPGPVSQLIQRLINVSQCLVVVLRVRGYMLLAMTTNYCAIAFSCRYSRGHCSGVGTQSSRGDTQVTYYEGLPCHVC